MTYNQAREAIRDLCSPHGFNHIKNANKAVKKYFGGRLVGMRQITTESETTMYYHVAVDDMEDGDYPCIGYDFWNRRIC